MKKVIVLFTALTLFLCPFFVNSQEQFEISLSSAEQQQGDEFFLELEAKNNPGVAAVYIKVEYDSSALLLIEAADGDVLEGFRYSLNEGEALLSWEPAVYNNAKNGILARLKFQVTQSAVPTKYKVKISPITHGVIDKDTNLVECNFISGNVTVKSPLPGTITSPQFNIDEESKIISKVSPQTSAKYFCENTDQAGLVNIYRGQERLGDSDNVGTGCVVKLEYEGKVLASYLLVVTGDCDGDGRITVADMIEAKAQVLNKGSVTGINKGALDTDGDGRITIADFINIKAHILNKAYIKGTELNYKG